MNFNFTVGDASISFIIIFCLLSVSRYYSVRKTKDFFSKILTSFFYGIGGCVIWIFFLLVMSRFFVEVMPSKSLIIDENKQIVQEVPKNIKSLFIWDERLKGNKIVSYKTKTIAFHFEDKRYTLYNLEIDRYGTAQDWIDYEKFITVLDGTDAINPTIQNWFYYQFYEFAKIHEKELETFYNPESKEQQEKFKKLIYEFFKPLIADKGMRIKNTKFISPFHITSPDQK